MVGKGGGRGSMISIDWNGIRCTRRGLPSLSLRKGKRWPTKKNRATLKKNQVAQKRS
jgi:hypothetical protein